MKKSFLLVAPLLFFVSILIIVLKTDTYDGKEPIFKVNSFIEGMMIISKKNGNKIWNLNAKKADIIENESKAKLTDIAMRIEDKGITISAPSGIFDMESRNLVLNSQTTVNAKDYTIIADMVEWNQSTEEIKTPGSIKIEGKKFRVEGNGMHANPEQKVKILKNVKATFYR